MGLTNPGRALGRSFPLLISLKLSTLSGIPLFTINSFRLASVLALLVRLNLSFLIRVLPCLLSAVLFMLTIWPFGLPPPRSPLQWRPHKELCFDWSAGRSTGYWCHPLNPSKCETSFFSVDPQHANLFVLNTRLRFNPTPTFLGVTFYRTLSFSKHVSSLKANFFPRLKVLHCISASSWGPLMSTLPLLYKAFLRPLLTYASPG